MINWRIKDFDVVPSILEDSTRLRIQLNAESAKDGDCFKSNHYGPDSVLGLLKAYSIGKNNFDSDKELAKCYYCESTSEVVASLQIEHYRPKSAIHDNNRQLIPSTSGYYWLGLEWTNLILACSKCNNRGAKGNIFTTKNENEKTGTSLTFCKTKFDRSISRADKAPLLNEIPDLLHPEINNSYRYLKFNSLGEIDYKLYRGKRTIEICKLDRSELNIARSQLIKRFQDSFIEVIEFYLEGLIDLNQIEEFFLRKCIKLREYYTRENPYTLLSRYMLEEFESFFVSIIPTRYKTHLRNAFIKSK